MEKAQEFLSLKRVTFLYFVASFAQVTVAPPEYWGLVNEHQFLIYLAKMGRHSEVM